MSSSLFFRSSNLYFLPLLCAVALLFCQKGKKNELPGKASESEKSDTYVVVEEFAFLRAFPDSPCAEEKLTVAQLTGRDPFDASPFLYYGENIVGTLGRLRMKARYI